MTCLWEELTLSVCNIDVIGKNFIILISFTINIIIKFCILQYQASHCNYMLAEEN